MKMSGFYDESISNGEGWRAVLFVSGCPHNCPGCQNKEAQSFDYGEEFDKEKINNPDFFTLENISNELLAKRELKNC